MNRCDIAIIITLVGGIVRLVEGFFWLLLYLPLIIFYDSSILMSGAFFFAVIFPIVLVFIDAILILAFAPLIHWKPVGAGIALIVIGFIGIFGIGGILALIGAALSLSYGIRQSQYLVGYPSHIARQSPEPRVVKPVSARGQRTRETLLVICPYCGYKNPVSSTICSNCGGNL